jgi:hypothetical protein
MSAYARSGNRNNRNKYGEKEKDAKKHCSVCEKAGLPERVYTGHFTKSVPGPKGIIICPTILNNECSFCFNRGHLKSACPAIAAKEKHEKKLAYEERRSQARNNDEAKSKKSTVYQNPYGGYESSDSEEDIVAPTKKSSLVSIEPMQAKQVPTFAEVLAREPLKPSIAEELSKIQFTVLRTAPTSTAPSSSRRQTSWVDLEDEDENW